MGWGCSFPPPLPLTSVLGAPLEAGACAGPAVGLPDRGHLGACLWVWFPCPRLSWESTDEADLPGAFLGSNDFSAHPQNKCTTDKTMWSGARGLTVNTSLGLPISVPMTPWGAGTANPFPVHSLLTAVSKEKSWLGCPSSRCPGELFGDLGRDPASQGALRLRV